MNYTTPFLVTVRFLWQQVSDPLAVAVNSLIEAANQEVISYRNGDVVLPPLSLVVHI